MTTTPWFREISNIDYTGYREFLSLLRYVHASRAYYSTLRPLTPTKEIEARTAMLCTHQAMRKAKSVLIHYKPSSLLIRRLVAIEWQYLLKSNQLWMPRISLAEPLSHSATIEMDRLTWRYLRDKISVLRSKDLDSYIEKVLMSLFMWSKLNEKPERANNFRSSLAIRSLLRSKKSIDFDFDEMVEQCELAASHLLLSPHKAWDFKQLLVIHADQLLGLYRHLIELSISLGESRCSGIENQVADERFDVTKLALIKAQYAYARTMLLFHFPEIIWTSEKRPQV